MSEAHPVRYLVKAYRRNVEVHAQEAVDDADARRLKLQFEAAPHTHAEIVEVHDPAETDLTTHTREIVEAIAKDAPD